MSFEIRDASKKNVRIKMALSGKAGAGKTLGSLKIAKGLMGDMLKVAVLETEIGRSEAYFDKVGMFRVIPFKAPYSPERYIEGIEFAESKGVRCLIIDSLSEEWAGTGGALSIAEDVGAVVKNTFTAWRKVTPRHNALFDKILQSDMHIICTVKKKIEYIMENVSGKLTPKRIGTTDIQREDTEYKWLLQFDLDPDGSLAKASKDNTSIFHGKPPFQISEQTGAMIRAWCLGGDMPPDKKQAPSQVNSSNV